MAWWDGDEEVMNLVKRAAKEGYSARALGSDPNRLTFYNRKDPKKIFMLDFNEGDQGSWTAWDFDPKNPRNPGDDELEGFWREPYGWKPGQPRKTNGWLEKPDWASFDPMEPDQPKPLIEYPNPEPAAKAPAPAASPQMVSEDWSQKEKAPAQQRRRKGAPGRTLLTGALAQTPQDKKRLLGS